ncbi:MAG: dihydropteroate synthase, partial [Nitrosomonadales bacterium]|nr:dihydropteroate synthase [Nitrosomonadales bacterium]
MKPSHLFVCGQYRLDLSLPRVMGIVNVTPDSFSDGGKYESTEKAVEHGLQLVAEGADILDVGGESTRPGATPVSLDDELARVVPVIEVLSKVAGVPISIDTYKPEVMRAAIAA